MMDAVEIGRMASSLEAIAQQLRSDAGNPAGSAMTIPLKHAAFFAGISEAQMRKRCEQSVYDHHAGGFGIKRGKFWEVAFAPFIATLPVGALELVKEWYRASARE